MGHRVLRQVFCIVFVCSTSAFAQSPDLEQLKSKLQQLEQMMQELKSQIVAAEQQQAPPGQPLVASKPEESPGSAAPSNRRAHGGRDPYPRGGERQPG